MPIKYDTIGTSYNATRQADPYITTRLLSLLRAKKDEVYLDLGCGTGNYTAALAEKGLKFVGAEPSETMLKAARERNQNIRWLAGTGELIPTDDGIFGGIIATLTIHHWSDLTKAFLEISRVLTANGRLIIFTSTPEQMKSYWLTYYFPKMLRASIVQMPSLHHIREAAEKADLQIGDLEKIFYQERPSRLLTK